MLIVKLSSVWRLSRGILGIMDTEFEILLRRFLSCVCKLLRSGI